MSAYRSTYITLGGLNCGTKGIDCYDWSDLLSGAPKRGQNRVLPDLPGRELRPKLPDEMRAALQFRLRGDYTTNGTYINADEDTWHQNIYSRLSTLRSIANSTETKTIQLITPLTQIQNVCQIEEMGKPRFLNPWIVNVVVDLTIPTGSFA